MREPASKLQQQFLILENKVFLEINVVFSHKRSNIEGKMLPQQMFENFVLSLEGAGDSAFILFILLDVRF